MSSTDWNWIEEGAEIRRDEYIKEISKALPTLELHYWTDEEYRQSKTDRDLPDDEVVEGALDMMRSQLCRTHLVRGKAALTFRAAGICSVISAETLFAVWGLTIEAPYCAIQYIEHRVDGSRVWVHELSAGFVPQGEWEILHLGFMQCVEPLFPMGSGKERTVFS